MTSPITKELDNKTIVIHQGDYTLQFDNKSIEVSKIILKMMNTQLVLK